MNFDDALKAHLPRVWFGLRFFKYKHRGRGEAELRLLRHFIEPGSTALDIGASIGIDAAEMARHAGKVIAFEANPEVAAFARSVAARNVAVVNVALSSAPGRTALTMPVNRKGHAVTELASIARREASGDAPTITMDVETRRLDDFAIANCGFIKIDVEGHEEAVLDGAANLIATQRPVLMIELDETLNAGSLARTTRRLAAQRYRGLFLSRGTMHPLADFDAAKHQDPSLLRYTRKTLPADREYINNFVFVPEEKAAEILARL